MSTLTMFSYGSNMLTARLSARIGFVKRVAIGYLEKHRLAWHKSGRDGSGKCNAMETTDPEDRLWGVVYRIRTVDKPILDRIEGLGHGYAEKQVRIVSNQGPLSAVLYVAVDLRDDLPPFGWYRDFVLAGALEHELPEPHIAEILQASVMPDANDERHQLNQDLISEALKQRFKNYQDYQSCR